MKNLVPVRYPTVLAGTSVYLAGRSVYLPGFFYWFTWQAHLLAWQANHTRLVLQVVKRITRTTTPATQSTDDQRQRFC